MIFEIEAAIAALLSCALFCPIAAQATAGGSPFVDSRDGQKYRTVKIGNQTWMAENLNYRTGQSWCYEDDESNCKKYGRLYDWNTAKEGACPNGWRLPNREEWNSLVGAAGGKMVAGKKLKSKSGWSDDNGKGGNGTDEFGFSALPGGYRSHSDGGFYYAGGVGNWWSAAEYGGGYAYSRRAIYHHGDYVKEDSYGVRFGLSIRCVGR